MDLIILCPGKEGGIWHWTGTALVPLPGGTEQAARIQAAVTGSGRKKIPEVTMTETEVDTYYQRSLNTGAGRFE